MFLVKKSRTFNEQKQNLKYFQGLKIRVLKFKGFQDGCKPCLEKKTLTAILSKLNALINLLHLGFYFNLKALLCIVKDKRQNNLK